ncbi:hypothetical protein FSP39_012958 [Pinctada imbricata]|uniref:Phospholipase A2-like central domain-containing protein n=1 Tax=Pinctada imbricata TaxID=66713 RepID=A0AA88XWH5_PINIB|nr:hypothetical protein FSP39_012958 [Pinctada imbricata]
MDVQVKNYLNTKNRRDSNSSEKPFAPEKTGEPEGGLGVGIFPGTKWCGLGNDASSYDDLGKFNVTDACCREHDHCPYFIDHFETKYNYQNPYPWTLSHCDCDNKLYGCLKKANTSASDEVGKLFFGLLNVHCFTFQEGEYCAKSHFSGLYCEEKGYGERAVTQTFPHQWGEDILG